MMTYFSMKTAFLYVFFAAGLITSLPAAGKASERQEDQLAAMIEQEWGSKFVADYVKQHTTTIPVFSKLRRCLKGSAAWDKEAFIELGKHPRLVARISRMECTAASLDGIQEIDLRGFSCLEELSIEDCNLCALKVVRGQLPSLKKLSIKGSIIPAVFWTGINPAGLSESHISVDTVVLEGIPSAFAR